MNDDNKRDNTGFLLVIISVTLILLLTLYYIASKGGDWVANLVSLVEQLVPNIIASIGTFVVAYYIFSVRGIKIKDQSSDNEASARQIISNANSFSTLEQGVTLLQNKVDTILRDSAPTWLSDGFESYTSVPWKNYLKDSRELLLVTFYFEKWIVTYRDSLISFMKQDKSKLTIYLPDYENTDLLIRLNEIIPIHTPEVLSLKIQKSIKSIKDILEQKQINLDRVEIKLYDGVFSYTMQTFDEHDMIISINEMRRDDSYSSPFIVIDLSESYTLKSLYQSEVNRLNVNSSLVDIKKWKAK